MIILYHIILLRPKGHPSYTAPLVTMFEPSLDYAIDVALVNKLVPYADLYPSSVAYVYRIPYLQSYLILFVVMIAFAVSMEQDWVRDPSELPPSNEEVSTSWGISENHLSSLRYLILLYAIDVTTFIIS